VKVETSALLDYPKGANLNHWTTHVILTTHIYTPDTRLSEEKTKKYIVKTVMKEA
jgi:hypothetical protein